MGVVKVGVVDTSAHTNRMQQAYTTLVHTHTTHTYNTHPHAPGTTSTNVHKPSHHTLTHALITHPHTHTLITHPHQDNINKRTGSPEDWRYREAATFAFGSILEGPTTPQLAQLVGMGLQFLLDAMQDTNTHVRNTTAWTIGRIFEFVHGKEPTAPVIHEQNLPKIMTVGVSWCVCVCGGVVVWWCVW